METSKSSTGMKRLANFRVPHTYVIIFSMIILAALLTYVIPAGTFDRYENANGVTVVDPDSFHYVESAPAGIMEILNAVPSGLLSQAGMIFFVFIMGGTFQVINSTGAIDMMIAKMLRALKGRESWIIPVFLFVFSMGGCLMGMSNEVLPFIPIGIIVARKAGFDTAVGTAMVALGAAAGNVPGEMQPFTTAVAQGIAELPLYSGMWYRVIIHITFLVIASFFLMRYAKRVKADPSKSIVYNLECQEAQNESVEFNMKEEPKHYLVMLAFLAGLGWILWGTINQGWGTTQMQPVFIAITIVCGLVGGLRLSKIAQEFVNGAKMLAFGALVIGIARGILVVLEDSMILDTIVYNCAGFLQMLPPVMTPVGMYAIHILLNIVIPSGSGQAAATMPLFIPLADVTGVTRQLAVLAFQLGDGITNSINPTSSNMNSYLSLSKIEYAQWVRFAGPIILSWLGAGLVFIIIGYMIGYGPF